jgi:hypothetical protein
MTNAYPGAVITIYCGPSICGGDCSVPILLFTPGEQSLSIHTLEADTSMNECCPDGYCPFEAPFYPLIPDGECFGTYTSFDPICLEGFSLEGKGASFDSNTFTNAKARCSFNQHLTQDSFTTGNLFPHCATVCTNINRGDGQDCYQEFMENESETPTGSPYWPAYCAKEVFTSCDQPLTYKRCWWPNWTEKTCRIITMTSGVA